jgi:isoamylase
MLSQGVPMLLGGDELGRTQGGNNNAYCQDNELSWFDWSLVDENLPQLGFTRRVMEFRQRHPVFQRRKWFMGREFHGTGVEDMAWFDIDGAEMTEEQWNEGFAKSVAVFINGNEMPDPGPHGEIVTDDSFLMLFNAHSETLEFTLPEGRWGSTWETVIDTDRPFLTDSEGPSALQHKAGNKIALVDRSLVVLRRVE